MPQDFAFPNFFSFISIKKGICDIYAQRQFFAQSLLHMQ